MTSQTAHASVPQPPRLPLLDIYRVGYAGFFKVTKASPAHGPLASDEYNLLWFMTETKEGNMRINGEPLHWTQGDLVLIRPGERASFLLAAQQELTCVLIGFSVREPAPESMHARWPRIRSDLTTRSLLPPLLRYCLRLGSLPEPERTSLLASSISLALQMFISGVHEEQRQSSASDSLPRPLAVAMSALLQPDTDLIRMTRRTLAQRAGITPGHLTRLATECLGVTVQRLIHQQRLRRACDLLSESELTVKEIAHRCGFVHASYFTRYILKELACTPTQYRAMPPEERPQAALPLTNALMDRATTSYSSIHLYGRCPPRATPDDLHRALRDEVQRERLPYAGLDASVADWRSVGLADVANRSRCAGAKGWINFRYGLTELAPGRQTFHAIPFDILDDRSTLDRSVLMMRSTHLSSPALPLQVQLPVNATVKALAILHACGWAGMRRQFVGEYEAEFVDGRRNCIPIWASGEPPDLGQQPPPLLQDWWPTYHQFDHASARKVTVFDPANPLGSIRYLYTYLWRNPRPRIPVKAWHIRTTGQQQATLAVLAVSVLPIGRSASGADPG